MSVLRVCSWVGVGFALACTPLEPDSETPEAPRAAHSNDADEAEPPGDPPVDEGRRNAGVLTASVTPGHAVLAGQPGHLDVMLELRGEGEVGARAPLDLVMVLDRSGSMGGEKILAVKQAAIEMLGQLGPEDDVALVSYSSDVQVHGKRRAANDHGKRQIRQELLGLSATGGTALGPALFAALDGLRDHERPDEVMAHVLLLSDGMANEGEQDPAVIARRAQDSFGHGVSTSTLGVGLDYNEDLMTRVADAGGGRYHFIENADAVPRVLSDEVAGLSATVARGIELAIVPPEAMEVERVFGYSTTSREDGVTALVGSLAAQQTRSILMRVSYPAPQGDAMALGTFDLAFVDASTGKPEVLSLRPEVDVVQTPEQVTASENVAVTVRVAEIEASEKLRVATEQMEKRNFAEAQGQIESAIQGLEAQNAATPSADLAEQIDEMNSALEDVTKAKTDEKVFRKAKKKNKSKIYLRGKK